MALRSRAVMALVPCGIGSLTAMLMRENKVWVVVKRSMSPEQEGRCEQTLDSKRSAAP